MIIGLTGTLGAGKTTVAEYLVTAGFVHKSVRAFIAEEIDRQNKKITRDSLVDEGNKLREKFGADYIIKQIIKTAKIDGEDAVIESIRAVGEAKALLEAGGFLVSVDADLASRYKRVISGKRQIVPVSFEQFREQEIREMHSSDESKQSIADVMIMAQFHVLNTGSYEALYKEVDRIVSAIKDMST